MSILPILPIEMINKILYECKGLQHPIVSKCKIHPTAIIMKQLFSQFLTPRVDDEHRYAWEDDRVGYEEMIEERFEDRQETKDTFYEDMGGRHGARWLIRHMLHKAQKYKYEDIHEEIQDCRLQAINHLLSSSYKTLLELKWDTDWEIAVNW